MAPTPEQVAQLRYRKPPSKPSVPLSDRTSELWDRLADQIPDMGSDDYIEKLRPLVALKEQIEAQVQPEVPFLDDPGAVGSLRTTYRADGSIVQTNSLGQVRVIPPDEKTLKEMEAERERIDQPALADAAALESASKIGAVIAAAKDGRAEASELYFALSAKDQHQVVMQGGDKILDLLEASVQAAGSGVK
jgi:hypothetical protein